MKKQFKLALLALIICFPLGAQIRGTHQEELRKWEFSKDGNTWQTVTLPHSYNAIDGHSPAYYRGDATYRCDFKVRDPKKSHFLLFEGAAQAAVVKVNGEQVAAHKGGYTPFVVDIGEVLERGTNRLEVICNNSEDINMAPVSSDFNKNGGLHGRVWLLGMDDVYFSPEKYGMYRLRVETPVVSRRKISTDVKTRIVNSGNKAADILVRVELLEADGTLGYEADREIRVKAFSEYEFSHDFHVTGIRFWDGVNDPYLYTMRVTIFRGEHVVDVAETKVGYRSMEMDPDRGFLLNGRPYKLRGVAMHQDMDGKASALTKEDYRRDYRMVKELGANFLRLAHYPHNDYAFRLCDSLGIIVQTEVPWVNVCGAKAKQLYFNNIQHQMKEMVTNLFNHPSIAFWGMWNELDTWGNSNEFQGEFDPDKVLYQTKKLYKMAKHLDPYRFIGFTDDSRLAREGYPMLAGDFCSQNIYFGWYYTPNDFSTIVSEMEKVKGKWKGPVNVSEYGVGNNPFCHVWDQDEAVRDQDNDSRHYEEYANKFHEAYARKLAQMPWLNFTSVWVMFDFPVANRQEGYMDSDDGVRFTRNNDRKYMNDKGLVTRDRKTRKDVFYLYKSLWNNSETTVCITSKRLRYYPAGEPLRIKVYSNAKSLTLYQNDKVVGKLTRPDDSLGVVWTFPSLYLDTYQDTFKVVADDGTSDSVTYYRK